MSKLAPSIIRMTKQKAAKGTIIDVMGPLCSVRLSTQGPILRALRYSGPTPKKGDPVLVDYRSGTPIVLTNSENLQKALDELRSELTATQTALTPSTNSTAPETVGGGSTSNLEFLDDIGDVDAASPEDGQVLTWNESEGAWVAADSTGTSGGALMDDLTSQIPATGDHFDLGAEASGEVLLFFNGILQPAAFYSMDMDNLGLTTTFSPVAGDTLIAIYSIGAFASFTDEDALHDPSEIWQQVVNESGASFTNFTSASGTWSSDGTVIKQTDTAATVRRAKYNTKQRSAVIVFQSDIQLKTNTSDAQVGLVVHFNGGSTTGGIAVHARLQEDDVRVDRDEVEVSATFSVTINIDTWYTLRIFVSGSVVSVYLDGTLLGTARVNQPGADASFIGLRTFRTEGWFRNIKAWVLPMPA